jgi:hypothetical protein
MTEALSGGCQCGAVRFSVAGAPNHASICHCRMCQKATGGPFGAYASFATSDLSWTRGQRKTFQSSDAIARGFCGDCGTPLTFEAASGAGRHIAVTIAAFDHPENLLPEEQLEVAARIPWVTTINQLMVRSPEDTAARAAKYPPVVSRQHPDHDTDAWPPGA